MVARRQGESVAVLLALAGLAWWWTARRMAGMDAGPGTHLGTLGWFTASWVVMMAAMMLPSFGPTLAAYIAATRERAAARWPLFLSGYLLVWAAVGLVAYGIFELGKAWLGGELAWHQAGRWVCGAVLVVASGYELVPLKRACLVRCRGQLGDARAAQGCGWAKALVMGARSGGWCLGCSWALMAALFALGVMSLTWMALIAALVLLEKASPWPAGVRAAGAVVLAALALGILLAPHQVPGLVVPGAAHTMNAMG